MKKHYFLLLALLLVSPFFSVEAQSVDLIWQGDGYASPFYRGRTLWSKQGVVNMVAIPQGLGNPASLNYRWTRNGTVLGNTNGIGQNSLSLQDSIISRPQTIAVEILSAEEEVVASASVLLAPTPPLVAVYEKNPLYGFMFHQEAGRSYSLQEREVSFAAFPLFFTVDTRSDGLLRYSWMADGSQSETRNLVTYRVPDEASGSSAVSARVSHSTLLLQEARKDFLVQFEEQ